MADNYLEKKMELYRAKACGGDGAKGKSSLLSLLDKCVPEPSFDDYIVREDQLCRIALAATKTSSVFSFKLFTRSLLAELSLPAADSACVLVCAPAEGLDFVLLGRVVQVMALQAAEVGLCAVFAAGADLSPFSSVVPEGFSPVALVLVGRPLKV